MKSIKFEQGPDVPEHWFAYQAEDDTLFLVEQGENSSITVCSNGERVTKEFENIMDSQCFGKSLYVLTIDLSNDTCIKKIHEVTFTPPRKISIRFVQDHNGKGRVPMMLSGYRYGRRVWYRNCDSPMEGITVDVGKTAKTRFVAMTRDKLIYFAKPHYYPQLVSVHKKSDNIIVIRTPYFASPEIKTYGSNMYANKSSPFFYFIPLNTDYNQLYVLNTETMEEEWFDMSVGSCPSSTYHIAGVHKGKIVLQKKKIGDSYLYTADCPVSKPEMKRTVATRPNLGSGYGLDREGRRNTGNCTLFGANRGKESFANPFSKQMKSIEFSRGIKIEEEFTHQTFDGTVYLVGREENSSITAILKNERVTKNLGRFVDSASFGNALYVLKLCTLSNYKKLYKVVFAPNGMNSTLFLRYLKESEVTRGNMLISTWRNGEIFYRAWDNPNDGIAMDVKNNELDDCKLLAMTRDKLIYMDILPAGQRDGKIYACNISNNVILIKTDYSYCSHHYKWGENVFVNSPLFYLISLSPNEYNQVYILNTETMEEKLFHLKLDSDSFDYNLIVAVNDGQIVLRKKVEGEWYLYTGDCPVWKPEMKRTAVDAENPIEEEPELVEYELYCSKEEEVLLEELDPTPTEEDQEELVLYERLERGSTHLERGSDNGMDRGGMNGGRGNYGRNDGGMSQYRTSFGDYRGPGFRGNWRGAVGRGRGSQGSNGRNGQMRPQSLLTMDLNGGGREGQGGPQEGMMGPTRDGKTGWPLLTRD